MSYGQSRACSLLKLRTDSPDGVLAAEQVLFKQSTMPCSQTYAPIKTLTWKLHQMQAVLTAVALMTRIEFDPDIANCHLHLKASPLGNRKKSRFNAGPFTIILSRRVAQDRKRANTLALNVSEIFYCCSHELTAKHGNPEAVDCLMYREIDNNFH